MRFKSRKWGRIYIEPKQYESGRMALQLMNPTGNLVAVLTVNLPEHDDILRPGEFFVKTWSENKEIAQEALASGLFVNTGRGVGTGHVEAQIWKFADE